MPSFSMRNRRDPWWGTDGPTARRERRRRRLLDGAAFASAVVAVAGAAFAWLVRLGLAAAMGLNLGLRIG